MMDSMEEVDILKREVANFKKEIRMLEYHMEEAERLRQEVTLLRKKLDEETIKTKFENSSNILDDILRIQKPSNDKTGLGYDNERKSKCSSLTNRERKKFQLRIIRILPPHRIIMTELE